ncbi:endo-1,4-beta-xylanase [Methylobacterium gossipiicola]|uniref:Beta-xylanase n=1 Tax=Methylobacterium gossipiicola TaxID=582675 RepID=A0A1I2RXG1_9HYPH|nr:endo-1,4-beta-xylanase [Methylobacterium gossipiicola]SFG45375.1 endo-1,4-beta-xylanase [Methylobacterium gossipiicola]
MSPHRSIEGRTRRAVVAGLGAAGLNLFGRPARASTEPGLAGHAARSGRVFGTAVRSPDLTWNATLRGEVLREAGLLVPEYEMKWDILAKTPGTYDFTGGDRLASFAEAHRLGLRGHTLVWHLALPPWLPGTLDAGEARRVMEAHVAAVAAHYAGRVQSWDVVNEAVDPQGPDGLRASLWQRALGADYIPLAFAAAARADPKAKLYYNEYDLECDTPDQDVRRAKTLEILTRLRREGVPVHGLGIQAHLQAGRWPYDAGKFARFLAAVAALDLDLLITEMDVSDRLLPASEARRDATVAALAGDVLTTFLTEPRAVGVVTWGLSDRQTWLNDLPTHRRTDGLPQRALPLDRDGGRKPLWTAMARAFDGAAPRP